MNRYIRGLFCSVLMIGMVFGAYAGAIPQTEADQALVNAQADRARLQSELDALEKEITQKQKELDAQKGQSVSLSRDIAILKTQIQKSKLDIQSKDLTIKKLSGEINKKSQAINTLESKIETEKETLAQLIRKDREIDEKSIINLVLSQDNISDVYGDIGAFASLKKGIKESVDEIRGIKSETESEKKNLEDKKNQETDVKKQLENAKKQVELNEQEQQKLLSISKDKESEYQKVLAEKARRKSEILAMLFDLRDVSAIPFGKAYEYAKEAEALTGIRPAFLLAILTQESNLGQNQGSCYLTNPTTGDGVSSKSGNIIKNVMKPTRDVEPFLEITSSVGRDPYKTLVSCPIAGYGYGGAMGPSQFIPSTWKIMVGRLASMLNIKNPDPWYPRDAFMASAIYLTDLGAVNGSFTKERDAACKYYSGRVCSDPKVKNLFYGNSVMEKAENIQTNMIDPLQS